MTPYLFYLLSVMLMALKLSSFKAQAHRAIPVLSHPWQAGIVIPPEVALLIVIIVESILILGTVILLQVASKTMKWFVISAQKTGTCPGTGLCIIADVVNGICVNCGKPRPKR